MSYHAGRTLHPELLERDLEIAQRRVRVAHEIMRREKQSLILRSFILECVRIEPLSLDDLAAVAHAYRHDTDELRVEVEEMFAHGALHKAPGSHLYIE